jgi:hypothetical protein
MDTGAECRIHAAEFLVQAKREPEREAPLISMAESWLRLAIKAVSDTSRHGPREAHYSRNLLDQLDGVEGYPPYNIARTSENAYRSIAGIQISNWILVLAGIIVMWIIYNFITP